MSVLSQRLQLVSQNPVLTAVEVGTPKYDGVSKRRHSATPWQWNQKVTQVWTLSFTASATMEQSGITGIVFE